MNQATRRTRPPEMSRSTEPSRREGLRVLLYWSEGGETLIEVRVNPRPGQTPMLWFSLRQLADLFERDRSVISKHLKAIFASGLDRRLNAAIFETTQSEGRRAVRRNLELFSVDVALAVGDRVRSRRASHFRTWADNAVRSHTVGQAPGARLGATGAELDSPPAIAAIEPLTNRS